MRVLWVAPWGRPLARVYLDALASAGTEVLLITTDRHPERLPASGYEVLVTGPPRQIGSWPSVVRAFAAARRFRADVVVAEEFHDPRLLPLLRVAPLATLVHDDAPHDPTERRALHHRLVFARVARQADLVVTFSRHVAQAVRPRLAAPVATVPLPSEAGEHLVPPLVPAEERRDFVLIGRINPYKNLPVTLQAWAAHVDSAAYRGDRLLIIGDGNEGEVALPPRSEWRRTPYQFRDVMPALAAAKGSLAYYSSATQSGVQVMSMQCGTAAVVSDVGGLPEYLPPDERPIPPDDPRGLTAALGTLADPVVAAERGRAARAHYETSYRPDRAARALLSELDTLRVRPRRAAARPAHSSTNRSR